MHKDAIIHEQIEQGSEDWHAMRCGLMTASEMRLVLTDTLKMSKNDKQRTHVCELAAQRITNFTEPQYISDAMMNGHINEVIARDLYDQNVDLVEEKGFITRQFDGFKLGYSPDGVGVMGNFGIEIKSRMQKYHLKTIAENEVPTEYMLQIQTGLLITEWDYLEYISYCAGMPMWVIRVYPDEKYQEAITEAAKSFEDAVQEKINEYDNNLAKSRIIIETEREIETTEEEIHIT
jgi:hypothetical protein